MGLFDGVGGVYGGVMPLGTMTPMGVATSMGAAASAVGVPGFSMAPTAFPLIAGLGWSSRSSYFGQPEFRGVADMATYSNDLQRGWSPGVGLGAGLGTFLGAPPIGSGGYYIGPGPQFFDPMAMFAWMYQQTFGAQQAGGPAQAAAPQPAQVNAKSEEPKADDAKEATKGRPARRRGGGARRRPATAAPAGGPVGTPSGPGSGLMDRILEKGGDLLRDITKGGEAGKGGRIPPASERTKYHELKGDDKFRTLTPEEKSFIRDYEREFGTD